jgi:S1-C subfamily serine protease
VLRGSDADALGLRGGTRREAIGDQEVMIGGDVILEAQGIAVTGAADIVAIREALAKTGAGQEIRVTVLRSGRAVELKESRPR